MLEFGSISFIKQKPKYVCLKYFCVKTSKIPSNYLLLYEPNVIYSWSEVHGCHFMIFLGSISNCGSLSLQLCICKAASQRCKNVPTIQQCLCKKNPISGKIFAKFYAVLLRKWVMLRFHTFVVALVPHFGTLFYFLMFFAFFGSFGPFTLFCCKLDVL